MAKENSNGTNHTSMLELSDTLIMERPLSLQLLPSNLVTLRHMIKLITLLKKKQEVLQYQLRM